MWGMTLVLLLIVGGWLWFLWVLILAKHNIDIIFNLNLVVVNIIISIKTILKEWQSNSQLKKSMMRTMIRICLWLLLLLWKLSFKWYCTTAMDFYIQRFKNDIVYSIYIYTFVLLNDANSQTSGTLDIHESSSTQLRLSFTWGWRGQPEDSPANQCQQSFETPGPCL